MNYSEKLEKFIHNKSSKKKLIVIYWPTASWKTKMSVEIAKKLHSEIISTDSRQIFRESDIWTAKISKEEMDWIKHHMIDICNLDQEYSVWEYKKKSEEIMEKLYSQNKIPILAGWTWLYIDSLIYDFQIPEAATWIEFLKDPQNHFEESFITAAINSIDWTTRSVVENAFRHIRLPSGFRLPPSITSIAQYAFAFGQRLPTTFEIPEGVTSIGDHAFFQTSIPRGFTLPSTLITLGEAAFADASLPRGFTLPEGLVLIANQAFSGATLTDGFAIPSSVSTIEHDAFYRATLPNNFVIPPTIVTICPNAFHGARHRDGSAIATT